MDLLLDTICNTFGGVLFIAILVVMLVQTSPATPAQQDVTQDPRDLALFERLSDEYSALVDDLSRLQHARNGQLRTLAALAPDDVREMLNDRRKKEADADKLRIEEARLEALVAALGEAIATTRTGAAESKAGLQKTLAEVERLKSELAREKASKVKELRTPIARRPGIKSEIGFVLQYGRVYLWHRYDAFGNPLGLNTDDFLVLGETKSGLQTTPRPTRGIPVTDSANYREALSSLMNRFDRQRHYLTFAVRPDSYDEFTAVRDVAIDLGFEYRLMPIDADSEIVDRGGSGGFVQ